MKTYYLRFEELSVVLVKRVRRYLIVAITVDQGSELIACCFGDGSVCEFPFNYFTPSGTDTPDFKDVSILDYGQTLRFGTYEVATDELSQPDAS